MKIKFRTLFHIIIDVLKLELFSGEARYTDVTQEHSAFDEKIYTIEEHFNGTIKMTVCP